MKKTSILLIIVQAISVVVLITFSSFANYRFQDLRIMPYGLSSNYKVITVPYAPPLDGKYLNNFNEQLEKILKQDVVTIIHYNDGVSGLEVYDTKGTYLNYKLKSGKYFNYEDFTRKSTDVLVKDGSFSYKNSVKNSGVFYSNMRKLNVIGVFDKSIPLFDGDQEYICSLFSTNEFRGIYYIDSKNINLAANIEDLFDRYNFQAELSSPARGKLSFFESVIWLYQQKYFSTMMFGIVIIYFNFFLFFIYFLSRQERKAVIHLRVGATKYKLFLHFSKYVLSCCILGSISGALLYKIIYYLLQNPQSLYLTSLSIFGIACLHSLITFLIFTILFCLKKFSKEKGGANAL